MSFYDGHGSSDGKSSSYYVRAVRAGQSGSFANLIISKSGGGIGAVTSAPAGINCGGQCSASFTPGAQITLTATSDTGSTFTGWSGGGCQGTGSCRVTMTDAGVGVTAFFVPKSSNSVKINIVSGASGEPLPEAAVGLDGQILATDGGGAAIFTGISLGAHDIAIQKSGFEPVNTRINVGAAGISKMTWSLIPVKAGGGKPVLTDVSSYYTNRNKKAFFLDGVDFTITFTASVNWNGKQPGYIRFLSPRGNFNEAAGSHTFNMGADFGPGGRLQAVAVSADGVSSAPFDANIEVMPKPAGADVVFLDDRGSSFSYSFTEGVSDKSLSVIVPYNGATVSASIPIFGDKEMGLGIKAQASVKVGSDGMTNYAFTGSHDNENPLKVAGCSFDTGWSIGGKASFRYREDLNQWRFDSGYFKAGLSAGKNIPAYYVWVAPIPVPFYLRGRINGSLDASVGFTGWYEGAGWQLDGTVKPGVGGKAIAGAGVASALNVEGYLGIDGSLLFGFPETPVFREASLALSGGVSAKALWFSYNKPLWEYTWSWPENSAQSLARSMLGEDILQDIRTLDWQPLPRNYGSGAPGSRQAMAADRAPLEAIPGLQIIPGQTDIYPYSYPSLVSLGDDLLLAWMTDDLTKTSNNRTSVVYSRYAGGQWSDAAKIGEDGTADSYPTLAATTAGAVAVWQDTATVLGDETTMDEVMAQQEIAVSLYDAAANAWGAPSRLTSNGYLDRSPLAAAVGNKVMTVWIANEQNDMFGSPTKPNTIRYAIFNGTSWSPAQTAAAGVGAILKSALTFQDNTATYVFSVDEDGDLSTLTDQDLYAITYDGSAWSAAVRLTEDSAQDTNPQLAHDASGEQLLVWYADGKFQMARNLDMANSSTVFTPGLSSGAADFRLVSGGNGQLFIVWPDASSKGQDIYMAPYDPTLNVWGKGMQMTDTDSMERTLTAAQTADGQVAVVYNRVATVFTPRDVQVGDKTVTMHVPGPGTTDLCMSAFALERDLAVRENGLTVSPESIAPGAALTFTAGVVNRGLKPAENIAVDFYYGDPAAGGVLIGQRQTIAGPLAAGEDATVFVDWTAPETPEAKDIYVVVDPLLGIEDKDRTNNAAHIAVFQPDLAITQAFGQTVGPVKRGLTISVTNVGLVAARNFPVAIKQSAADGGAIYEEIIDELAPGEKRDVAYTWDIAGLVATDGYLKVYAEANGERAVSESGYLNNTRTMQVSGVVPEAVAAPGVGIPDGATDVAIPPPLSWEAASGATAYDVYLWKDGDARPLTPSIQDTPDVTATITFPLSPFTTYHWQVVAKNASGQTEGEEWTFTTGNVSTGSISGRVVSDLDGQAIEGMIVHAGAYSAWTDSDGVYTITDLPAGSYNVQVSAFGTYGADYLSEYYDNVTDSSSATPVAVTAGQTTPNIHFGLAELGKITGKVTREADGSPVAGVWIAAENYSTGAYGGGGCAKSGPDGSYTISGLSSGDYRLEANTGGTDYALKYFNDALSFSTALKVNVILSQTANADFQLLSLPAFRGDISGDGKIDLADAILAIGIPAGVISEAMVYKSGDVNGNGKIGTEEAVYDLQGIARIREMPLHAPLKIDGILAPGEWDDAKTAEITVEEGWVVNVFYKNDADNLYVAFTNLKPQSGELYPEIRLDVNNDKSSSWKSDDWWFHTSYNNCEMRGGYNIWSTCERAKLGWSGNIFPLTTPGTVEIRIEYEKLGLVSGEARDIGVAFDVTDTRTKWKFWPSSASMYNPSTWGTWHIE